ncbi:Protein of unknown function [Bacillus mycoides]|uniref:Uncharacterized protein n=1 Tax=Bacillus mycoides TaxID=1405 RepID=A0A1D3MLA6_BACMY|nr:Protein of unknown function [Bacillus mycoides]SCM86745.1 Protein of unknown function [Bacillus mycoides]
MKAYYNKERNEKDI